MRKTFWKIVMVSVLGVLSLAACTKDKEPVDKLKGNWEVTKVKMEILDHSMVDMLAEGEPRKDYLLFLEKDESAPYQGPYSPGAAWDFDEGNLTRTYDKYTLKIDGLRYYFEGPEEGFTEQFTYESTSDQAFDIRSAGFLDSYAIESLTDSKMVITYDNYLTVYRIPVRYRVELKK